MKKLNRLEKKQIEKIIRDTLLTAGTLIIFLLVSLWIEAVFHTYSLIPAFFTLAVFLISLWTDGFVYGIIASLLSVMALNFAFTFPYFKFNFTIPENLVSAVIMLIVTIMSSAMTTKMKQQEKIKAETEKEKMKANLLRAVSHDLRTPLTTIYGSSSIIADQYHSISEEQRIKLAQGIKEDSEWLIQMIENLLSITRIDNTGVTLQKSPTVLEELIDSVLIKYKKKYSAYPLAVTIPDDFVIIPMDAVLIQQVIFNILENAIIHAKGMTELKLNVFIDGDNAVFEVIDNGCGIDKDRLNSIFTGYYEKKDMHVDAQKHNMGIGLSACASIIKAHGGTIHAENLSAGGCRFYFILKLETEEYEQQI